MQLPYAITGEERERLILEYLPKVRWIAAAIKERLPASITEDDLISTGIIGLIAAIDNYDPTRNAGLWTYAEHRIRGAMLDSVRGLDGIAPHKRKHMRCVQGAISAAEQRLQRTASSEEVAAELGISTAEYDELLTDLRGISLASLDEGEGAGLARFVPDANSPTPAELLERTELEQLLAAGIETLPETERMILHLYFVEELTLAEVGRVMDLHFSRISQLKSQAVLRLRSFLERRIRTGMRSPR